MPQLDPAKALFLSQLFWLAVSFGLLYLFIAFYVTPRLEGIMKHRKSLIQADLDTAEQLRAHTQGVIEGYDAKVTAAKKLATTELEQARLQINQDAEAKKQANAATIAAQLEKAEAGLAKQRAEALASIQDMAVELTTALVQKVSGVKETAKSIAAAVKAAG